jgi:hypothetical protein
MLALNALFYSLGPCLLIVRIYKLKKGLFACSGSRRRYREGEDSQRSTFIL